MCDARDHHAPLLLEHRGAPLEKMRSLGGEGGGGDISALPLIPLATAAVAVGDNDQGDDEYEQAQEGRHDQQNEDAPLQCGAG